MKSLQRYQRFYFIECAENCYNRQVGSVYPGPIEEDLKNINKTTWQNGTIDPIMATRDIKAVLELSKIQKNCLDARISNLKDLLEEMNE